MLSAQPSAAFLDILATAVEDAITGATAVHVGLFTAVAGGTITEDTVLADLTLPTFAGYAPLVVAAAGSRRSDAAGDIILPMGTATFQPSGAVSPNQTAIGVYVSADTDLWLAELFTDADGNPVTFTFAEATDALDVIEEIYVRNGTIYGGICTTCPELG